MSPISHIVALTDFSEAAALAATRAAGLARLHGASLTLAHAIAAPGPDVGLGGTAALGVGVGKVVDAVSALLERDAQMLRERHAIGVDTVVLEGAVHQRLPALLDAREANLVVIGAHGEGKPRSALLGSVADRLLRTVDRPVLLVRREATSDSYKRVALATDFSESSERAALFGLRLAPAAEHVLLHADEPMFATTLAYAGASGEAIGEYRRASSIEAMRNLEAFAQRLQQQSNTPTVPALREGRPWQALSDLVDEAGIDLAVVGQRGRSRMEAFLLGSTSRYAATALGCDALVVP